LKTTRRVVQWQGDDTSLCLNEKNHLPHHTTSNILHHHVAPVSIKEISSKKMTKKKEEKKRKEDAYPKAASLTYHSISTHFNIPSTSELRKM